MTQLSPLRLDPRTTSVIHAVINTSIAICGVEPDPLSDGWYMTEGNGDEVTCARCRKKLVKLLGVNS